LSARHTDTHTDTEREREEAIYGCFDEVREKYHPKFCWRWGAEEYDHRGRGGEKKEGEYRGTDTLD
jgi:hypothetical protein